MLSLELLFPLFISSSSIEESINETLSFTMTLEHRPYEKNDLKVCRSFIYENSKNYMYPLWNLNFKNNEVTEKSSKQEEFKISELKIRLLQNNQGICIFQYGPFMYFFKQQKLERGDLVLLINAMSDFSVFMLEMPYLDLEFDLLDLLDPEYIVKNVIIKWKDDLFLFSGQDLVKIYIEKQYDFLDNLNLFDLNTGLEKFDEEELIIKFRNVGKEEDFTCLLSQKSKKLNSESNKEIHSNFINKEDEQIKENPSSKLSSKGKEEMVNVSNLRDIKKSSQKNSSKVENNKNDFIQKFTEKSPKSKFEINFQILQAVVKNTNFISKINLQIPSRVSNKNWLSRINFFINFIIKNEDLILKAGEKATLINPQVKTPILFSNSEKNNEKKKKEILLRKCDQRCQLKNCRDVKIDYDFKDQYNLHSQIEEYIKNTFFNQHFIQIKVPDVVTATPENMIILQNHLITTFYVINKFFIDLTNWAVVDKKSFELNLINLKIEECLGNFFCFYIHPNETNKESLELNILLIYYNLYSFIENNLFRNFLVFFYKYPENNFEHLISILKIKKLQELAYIQKNIIKHTYNSVQSLKLMEIKKIRYSIFKSDMKILSREIFRNKYDGISLKNYRTQPKYISPLCNVNFLTTESLDLDLQNVYTEIRTQYQKFCSNSENSSKVLDRVEIFEISDLFTSDKINKESLLYKALKAAIEKFFQIQFELNLELDLILSKNNTYFANGFFNSHDNKEVPVILLFNETILEMESSYSDHALTFNFIKFGSTFKVIYKFLHKDSVHIGKFKIDLDTLS